MPIFEIKCLDCGREGEVLVMSGDAGLVCPACGSGNTEKLLSPTSSLTGRAPQGLPGPSDHTCCGSSPSQAGCAGPGSCCGRLGTD